MDAATYPIEVCSVDITAEDSNYRRRRRIDSSDTRQYARSTEI